MTRAVKFAGQRQFFSSAQVFEAKDGALSVFGCPDVR